MEKPIEDQRKLFNKLDTLVNYSTTISNKINKYIETVPRKITGTNLTPGLTGRMIHTRHKCET